MPSASVVVAHVSHTRSGHNLKATSRRTATYTLDLPLSSDFPIDIKADGQCGKPGALVDEVNVVVAPSLCSEEESSSLSSSSSDHHDFLTTPSPLLDTLSGPGHFAASVDSQKFSVSVSPHLADKQEEPFPANCKRSAEVSDSPLATPASQGPAQSSKSVALGDTTGVSPQLLAVKHQRHSLTPQRDYSEEQSLHDSTHPAQRSIYKSRYSASEPGHGDPRSTFPSPRIGKPSPLQPSAYRSYAAVRGTAEDHSTPLRMSNVDAVYPRHSFTGTSGVSSANSTPCSATMTFPSTLPNEDGTLVSPLQSPTFTGDTTSRPPKKLKKPPPSGYRSPAERMTRHRAIAMTSRPHDLMDRDVVIDLTDSPSTPFPSSSSENAYYFAQCHSQPDLTPTHSPIYGPTNTSIKRTTTNASSSCTSGSGSGDDSTFSASSMYASTAPTSPSATSDSAHKSFCYPSNDHPSPQGYPSVSSPHSPRSQDQSPSSSTTFTRQHIQPSTPFIFPSPQASQVSQKPRYIPDYPPPPPPPPKSSASPASRKLTKKNHTSRPVISLPPPSRSAHEARLLENAHREQAQTHTRTIFGVKFTLSSPTKEKRGWFSRSRSRDRSRSRSKSRERNSTEKHRRKSSSSKWPLAEDEKTHTHNPPRTSSVPYIPSHFVSPPMSPMSLTTQSIRSPTSPNTLRKPRHSHPSSSRVLSDYAFTGTTPLSSSALAALTSQMHVREHSPERFDPSWEPDYSSYDQLNSPLPGEARSDDGHGMASTSEFGVKVRGKARSEIGHGSSYSAYGMTAVHEAPFTKTHGNSGASRSSSVSFLSQDPYAQPLSYPRSRHRDSLLSQRNCVQSRPLSQAQEIPSSLEQRRRDVSRNSRGDPLAESMRRWTLAMDVTDEVLVQELERLRKEGVRGRSRSRTKPSDVSCREESSRRKSGCEFVYGGPSITMSHTSVHARSPVRSTSRSGMFHLGEDETNDWDHDGGESDDEYALSDEDEDILLDDDESDWKIARRALLCCRELIITERAYQTHLRSLLAGNISPTALHPRVPALVLTYLPALLNASEAFLSRMEEDPSAWGVSAAWLGCEEEMESAFVGWCGIVGELFVDEVFGHKLRVGEAKEGGRNVLKKTTPVSSPRDSVEMLKVARHTRRTQSGASLPALVMPQIASSGRRMSASGPQSGMFTAALGTGLPYGLSPSVLTSPKYYFAPQHVNDAGLSSALSPTSPVFPTSSYHIPKAHKSSGSVSLAGSFTAALKRKSLLNSTTSLVGSEREKEKKEKKASVRELAIQPTQRIMRYVLQYRDLLQHTPASSPSRALVERALESAVRIAQKCDRAQDNSAFLRR